jgi:hypothetical protein
MDTHKQIIRLGRSRSRLWWIPGALAALTGVIYLIAADTGNYLRWWSLALLWLILAACLFRRFSHPRNVTTQTPNGDTTT